MSSSPGFWSVQSLISISSVVGLVRFFRNHGGEFHSQQVLYGPHPAPSQRIFRVEDILVKASACRVTKVVVSDEGRHWRRWDDTGVDAGAYTSEVRVVLV